MRAAGADPDTPFALYQHRGTRAIQRMVEYAPSTGGLALWVRHLDVNDEAVLGTDKTASSAAPAPTAPPVPPVTTDGHTIRYSASFESLPLAEQVGWVAHEVLHRAAPSAALPRLAAPAGRYRFAAVQSMR